MSSAWLRCEDRIKSWPRCGFPEHHQRNRRSRAPNTQEEFQRFANGEPRLRCDCSRMPHEERAPMSAVAAGHPFTFANDAKAKEPPRSSAPGSPRPLVPAPDAELRCTGGRQQRCCCLACWIFATRGASGGGWLMMGTMVRVMRFQSSVSLIGITGWMFRIQTLRFSGPVLKLFWNGTLIRSAAGFCVFFARSVLVSVSPLSARRPARPGAGSREAVWRRRGARNRQPRTENPAHFARPAIPLTPGRLHASRLAGGRLPMRRGNGSTRACFSHESPERRTPADYSLRPIWKFKRSTTLSCRGRCGRRPRPEERTTAAAAGCAGGRSLLAAHPADRRTSQHVRRRQFGVQSTSSATC
jgi:hypothetical protein